MMYISDGLHLTRIHATLNDFHYNNIVTSNDYEIKHQLQRHLTRYVYIFHAVLYGLSVEQKAV